VRFETVTPEVQIGGLHGWHDVVPPTVRHDGGDWDDRITRHAAAMETHALTRRLFVEFHHRMRSLDETHLSGMGLRLEIGCGVFPMKHSYGDVLATDVVPAPSNDRLLDAEDMDLPDQSVRCIYGQFVFHHLAHPSAFLREVERVCVPGGGAVLLEPASGPLAGLLYKNIIKGETFDRNMIGWEASITDQTNGANQALGWIVFERDRERLKSEHPSLEVVVSKPSPSFMRYIASGGLNFPQLVPTAAGPLLAAVERALTPVLPIAAIHQFYLIRRG